MNFFRDWWSPKDKSPMPFYLDQLPEELLVKTFSKMEVVPLNKCRKTTKWINLWIEKNGNRMATLVGWKNLFYRRRKLYVFKEENDRLIEVEVEDKDLEKVSFKGKLIVESLTLEEVPRLISLFNSLICDGISFYCLPQALIAAVLQQIHPKSITVNGRGIGHRFIYDKELTNVPAYSTAKTIALELMRGVEPSLWNKDQVVTMGIHDTSVLKEILLDFHCGRALVPSLLTVKIAYCYGYPASFSCLPLNNVWNTDIHMDTPLGHLPLSKLSSKWNIDAESAFLFSLDLPEGDLLAMGICSENRDDIYFKPFSSSQEMMTAFFSFGPKLSELKE